MKLQSPKGDVGEKSIMELHRVFKRKIKAAGSYDVASKRLPYRSPKSEGGHEGYKSV